MLMKLILPLLLLLLIPVQASATFSHEWTCNSEGAMNWSYYFTQPYYGEGDMQIISAPVRSVPIIKVTARPDPPCWFDLF